VDRPYKRGVRGTVVGLEAVVGRVLACMVVAILLRRDGYLCASHHGHAQPALAA
jgi:hypothetical protein